MKKNKEILSVLEEMAPLAYAEAFDNVGLLLGDQNEEGYRRLGMSRCIRKCN
jgi:putative NIF3 family GTP cyclohydrolase 1 type 2